MNEHVELEYIDYNLQPKVRAYYGYDIQEQFINVLSKYKYDKIYFVTEKVIYDFHGQNFVDCLKKNSVPTNVFFIGGTEKEKTFQKLGELCNRLIESRISKDSIIISFGGGIVGNVTGLAAGLIYRGIRYIEISTTFMGHTDSTLSNKQAVNGDSGKNQLGRYYAPIFLWADLKYIMTETPRSVKAAIVEGVKNALIQDIDLFDELTNYIYGKDEFTKEDLYYLYKTIVNSKNKILANDPTERGYGVVLEYGHTFGHAIEFLSEGKIIHGEAVSVGMCIAAEVGCEIGNISKEDVDIHYKVFNDLIFKNNPIVDILKDISVYEIMKAIEADNKRTINGIKYVVLKKLGKCDNSEHDYQIKVDRDVVISCIKKGIARICNMKYEVVLENVLEELHSESKKTVNKVLDEYFDADYDKDLFKDVCVKHIALYIGEYQDEAQVFGFKEYILSQSKIKVEKFEFGPSYIVPKEYDTQGWWYSATLDQINTELFSCRNYGSWSDKSEEEKYALMSHFALGVKSYTQFCDLVDYIKERPWIKMIKLTENDSLGHTYVHFLNSKNSKVIEILLQVK